MLIACNRKNLKANAQKLLGNEYSKERETALIRECLTGFVPLRGHHPSHARREHLERIDAILGTCGVEGMLLDGHGEEQCSSCSMVGVVADIQYCNAGDTYDTTILYHNGKLKIGDWGSIAEDLS